MKRLCVYIEPRNSAVADKHLQWSISTCNMHFISLTHIFPF